jgi:hypothetical protein
VIFYHSDVDALHARVVSAGYRPETAPRDAEWGERFFHLTDPDGHDSALPGRCDEAPAPSTCRSKNASPCLTQKALYKGLSADSEEKRAPVSDINTALVDRL